MAVVDEASKGKSEKHTGEAAPLRSTAAWALWPCICALPLLLTTGDFYQRLFPARWYDEGPVVHELSLYGIADVSKVKPLGLALGLLAVAVGQFFTVVYHRLRLEKQLGATRPVQLQARSYSFAEGLATHLSQPEGFGLLGSYLIGTWMLGWMPASYYGFAGGINWTQVAAQLLLQDAIQCFMHLGEHKISAWVYKHSHKPHHRFTNPRIFDAFDGSLADTTCMILIPLVIVARLVSANVWTYMTFGTLYANWLVLIHSEFVHPWDRLFQSLGFGTAADHHVHHRLFVFNYGHLFSYWDRILGTYKSPLELAGVHFSQQIY